MKHYSPKLMEGGEAVARFWLKRKRKPKFVSINSPEMVNNVLVLARWRRF
jgi:hypothetical protein